MPYDHRAYRSYSASKGLVSCTACVQETDLFISARSDVTQQAMSAIEDARAVLGEYILRRPGFKTSLEPIAADPLAHALIQEMLEASRTCSVGPMAAVAGAVAEFVGRALLEYSPEIIVENGGDLFLCADRELTIGIFAGPSPLSEKIGILIPARDMPLSLCTSSGTVGPSLSFGRADAVCVRSRSAALADAAATAIGNLIKNAADIAAGIEAARSISLLDGIVIIKDDQIGAWGDIELVALERADAAVR
ncbi:MAG: UPF0280 family protein [Deltaproteobacteria bacterium]|nr:UPF0280 family protein [Deltaproteobacteria bacterium]